MSGEQNHVNHKLNDTTGKGILKRKTGSNDIGGDGYHTDSVVMSNIQFPTFGLSKTDILDGNNTTSKINTSSLQNKLNRRVSFAPDVTLHSFDFIPEQQMKLREPRRKLADSNLRSNVQNYDHTIDDAVTSTQNNVIADVQSNIEIDNLDTSNMDFTVPTSIVSMHNKQQDDDSMDITQLFSKHSAIPLFPSVQVADSQEDIDDEIMNLDKIPATLLDDVDQETGMDFTAVIAPTMPNDSQQMDVTEIFQNVVTKSLPQDMGNDTMEFTMIQPNINSESLHRGSGSQTVMRAKRRKLGFDGSYTKSIDDSPTRDSKDTTPTKNTQDDNNIDDDMEFSIMERMSPIKLPVNEENDALEEYITTTGNFKINTESTHVVSEQLNESEYEKYSIKKFLNDTNTMFKVDTKLIENELNTLDFNLISNSKINSIRMNQLYNSFYVDIPILEMNSFISKELLRRIAQSKKLFEDLEKQVSTSYPPLLFREYFSSSPEMKEVLGVQIQLVKSYSALEAKKAWYEWRIQHLIGIKNVLIENLSILKEEYEKVIADFDYVDNLKIKAESLRDDIRREIKLLKNLPSSYHRNELSLEDKVRLEKLKQELSSHAVKIGHIQELKNEKTRILEQINDKNGKLSHIKNELSALDKTSNSAGIYTDYEITRLKKKLSLLQIITGLQFVSMKDAILVLKLEGNCFPEISVDLSKNNTTTVINEIIYLNDDNIDPFFQYLFCSILKIVNSKVQGTALEIMSALLIELKTSIQFLVQCKSLSLLYPIAIVHEEKLNKNVTLEITDYDIRNGSKLKFIIPMKEFTNLGINKIGKLNIIAHIDRGEDMSRDEILSRITKRTGKLLPWMSNDNINLLIR